MVQKLNELQKFPFFELTRTRHVKRKKLAYPSYYFFGKKCVESLGGKIFFTLFIILRHKEEYFLYSDKIFSYKAHNGVYRY